TCALPIYFDWPRTCHLGFLTNAGVLKCREIPGGKSGANQSIAANVPVKTKIRGYVAGREKRVGVEPLAWLTKDNGSGEVWVEKRTHRIARIAVPGRVVAELRR